jgi:CRISPR-associated protein Cas1
MDRCVEISSSCDLEIHGDCLSVINEEGIKYASLEGVTCLLISGRKVGFDARFLTGVSEVGVPILTLDDKFLPGSITLPVKSKSGWADLLRKQARLSSNVTDLLWRKIVRSKVKGQINVLTSVRNNTFGIDRLLPQVDRGDPKNIEAQAAKLYWPRIFDNQEFRRFDGSLPSVLLNYGYTILMACVLRRVVGVGLSPNLAIHHTDTVNPAPLVSDLMEPFRPHIDRRVCQLLSDRKDPGEITAEDKRSLIAVMDTPVSPEDGGGRLSDAIDRVVHSFRELVQGGGSTLVLPKWGFSCGKLG